METAERQMTGRRFSGVAIASLLGVGLVMPQGGMGAIIAEQFDAVDQDGNALQQGQDQVPWRYRVDDPGNFANTFDAAGTHFVFGGADATATWTQTLPTAGNWSVEMWMPSRSATGNALLIVEQGANSTQSRLSQSDSDARWSGGWLSLGVYNLDAGDVSVTLDNDGASGGGDNVALMTGALRFAQLEDGVTPFILDSHLGPVGSEGEFYEERSGIWQDSGTGDPLWGQSRISQDVGAEAVFAGMPLAAGLYEVDLTWGAFGNRTQNALLTIIDADEVAHQFTIDQTQAPSDIEVDGQWWDQFGTFNLDFAGGISEVRLSSDDGDWLSADAVRLTLIPEPASLALLGAGGLLLLSRRNRRWGG